MTRRCPQFQLGIASRSKLKQCVFFSITQLDVGDRLRMAAVEAFRKPQDRGETTDGFAFVSREAAKPLVLSARFGLTVIPCDEPDELDLVRFEPAQVAVLNQILRMAVMLLVADVNAHIMQEGCILEPLPLPVGQPVRRPRLVEERERQTRNLLGVLRPIVAALTKLDHASPPDVGILIGLSDFLPMAGDVIEDETFPKREIAQRDLLSAKPAEQRVEKNGSGYRQVRAPRIKPRHSKALGQIEMHQATPDAMQLLRAHAPVPKSGAGALVFGGGDSSEAEDGA